MRTDFNLLNLFDVDITPIQKHIASAINIHNTPNVFFGLREQYIKYYKPLKELPYDPSASFRSVLERAFYEMDPL